MNKLLCLMLLLFAVMPLVKCNEKMGYNFHWK